MKFDPQRLARLVPFVPALVIVVGGWLLLVQPAASANARLANEVAGLQQRMAQVRASASQPAPPPPSGDPRAAFSRQVASGDGTSRVVEQVARLAANVLAAGLMIETGERVVIGQFGGAAPQASGELRVDPRLAFFETPLTYTPVSVRFEAEFPNVGQFFWQLRELGTVVEIRQVTLTPLEGRVRPTLGVNLTLFAYAKQAAAAGSAGAAR